MENPEIERIQAAYLERLRRLLKRAPAEIRDDALREVRTHIEDEWRALGGDLPALEKVLERMGPPEAYGRDLALQLMLQAPGRRSPGRLVLAAIFWASTSLAGALVILSAAAVLLSAVGMVVVAAERLRGGDWFLIDAAQFQFFQYQASRLRFPPESWPPGLVALAGLLPGGIMLGGLFRFATGWARSRLARRGLEWVTDRPASDLPKGWERRALLAMLGFAASGLFSCLLFGILGGLVPLGQAAAVSLPEDFFRSPLTAAAFVGCLLFLCSPVLGLLWAARRALRRSPS